MKKRRFIRSLLALVLCLVLMLAFAGFALAEGTTGNSPVVVDLAALWVIISGFVVTIVVGLLTRKTWPNWKKMAVVIAVAAVLGLANVWIQGETVWNWANWWPIAAAVFVSGKIWFEAIVWKLPAVKAWWESHGLKPKAVQKK